MALVSLLAFWTGGDRARIDQLFRQSGLYREKWDADRGASTYGENTIGEVLNGLTETYDPTAAADGGTAASVPAPEQLIAEIEAGERSYGDDVNTRDPPGGAERWCSPAALVTNANLDVEDGASLSEAISELTDRQAAAHVWELMKQSDEFHVCVRCEAGGEADDELRSYDSDAGVWTPDGERALRHAARQALTSIDYSQNVLTELKAQVRGDPEAEVDADTFGVDTGEIAVANGLLNLDAAADGAGDDALRPLRPDDYALACLPVEYDPEAESERWQAFVEEVAEDSEAADALQEYVGYCLHVGAMLIHRALLLVGTGANGKSTFPSVVQALLGEQNTSSLELQTLANERDAVADFYGSLANIDDDLSARKLGNGIGMFKKLTAGDRVRARHLYEPGFEVQATGKHLYAANEVPDVSEDVDEGDEAFWRRWLLIEFPNYYPPNQRDPTLRDDLTDPEALSAVLNWAIRDRARLFEAGPFTGEELLPQDKRHRWQAWGDSVDKFISECVENDPDAPRMTTGDAYRRFQAWCDENGLAGVGQQKFTNTLKQEDVGYGKHRIDGTVTNGYRELGLSDDVPDPDDHDDGRGDQTRL